MTVKHLEQGQKLVNEIEKLQSLTRMLKINIETISHQKTLGKIISPLLKFVNRAKEFGKSEEAAIYLFNGIDVHGLSIPVDEEVLILLHDFFEKKIADKKFEFERLGKDDGSNSL